MNLCDVYVMLIVELLVKPFDVFDEKNRLVCEYKIIINMLKNQENKISS